MVRLSETQSNELKQHLQDSLTSQVGESLSPLYFGHCKLGKTLCSLGAAMILSRHATPKRNTRQRIQATFARQFNQPSWRIVVSAGFGHCKLGKTLCSLGAAMILSRHATAKRNTKQRIQATFTRQFNEPSW